MDNPETLLLPEEIPLTDIENRAIDIAIETLTSRNFTDGRNRLIQLIQSTGCVLEFIKSGSDPNVGRMARNRHYPQGIIYIMDTSTVSEESKIYNLVHEFMYLQLHLRALPDNDKSDLDQPTRIFASGLPSRIQADIRLAEAMAPKTQEIIIPNRKLFLIRIKDREYALEKSRQFLTYH